MLTCIYAGTLSLLASDARGGGYKSVVVFQSLRNLTLMDTMIVSDVHAGAPRVRSETLGKTQAQGEIEAGC